MAGWWEDDGHVAAEYAKNWEFETVITFGVVLRPFGKLDDCLVLEFLKIYG
jgi:hypothetical protein